MTTNVEDAWASFLLSNASDSLRGGVLLACCDAGIQVIARHRQKLAEKFLLDLSNKQAQLAMLNKLATYRIAQAADVPTPRFWTATGRAEIEALRRELVYPLIVKPLFSHVYESYFHRKFVVVNSFEELLSAHAVADRARIEVMLVELIPGPDDRLCSYYTYLDENGRPLLDLTKRIIRRYPVNMGGACYHITDWNPEVKEQALKLFQQAGLRGLANAEFKRDQRNGQLKLIECNARFTAANCLVTAAGYDLALFVYNRLTGRPQPPLGSYKLGLRLWDPLSDYHAYRELSQRGELTFGRWLASLISVNGDTLLGESEPAAIPARSASKGYGRPLLALRACIAAGSEAIPVRSASKGYGRPLLALRACIAAGSDSCKVSPFTPPVMTYFHWSDPWPTLVVESKRIRDFIGRRLRRLAQHGKDLARLVVKHL